MDTSLCFLENFPRTISLSSVFYEEDEEEGGLVYPMEQEDKVTEDSEEPFINETKQITKKIEKLLGKKEKRQIVR